MTMKHIAGEDGIGKSFPLDFYTTMSYQVEREFDILVYIRQDAGMQLYIDESDWNKMGLMVENYCKGYMDNERLKDGE